MSTLPITAILSDLLTALHSHPTVILQAPPGAGKSTALPLFLMQQDAVIKGKILLLEPRRLAARSIAHFLATQLGESVGERVGYRMRSERKVSKHTRLEIITEGLLTRLLQHDPLLEGVDALIFDEFHERSLQADLGLALALDVQQSLRPDLKILIMSATLDNQALGQRLQAPVLISKGRQFPITHHYVPCERSNYVQQLPDLLRRILSTHAGSILVFLPGMAEIRQVEQALIQQDLPNQVQVFALHGRLDKAMQQQAIAQSPAGQRKVVLATNVAETSLTIDGISVVVDSGYHRVAQFQPKSGFTQLQQRQISQASMIQRSGRAGRLAAGDCYHLASEAICQRRIPFDPPELCSSDLSALLLDIAAWGSMPSQLFWLDPLPNALLEQGYELLIQLKLMDATRQITALGRKACDLGLPPRLAAILLQAQTMASRFQGIDYLACYVVSFLFEQTSSTQQGVDLEIMLRTSSYQTRGVVAQQAQALAKSRQIMLSQTLPWHLTGLLLAYGFPDRIAKARGQGYQLANGYGASLPAQDALQGKPWLVVADAFEEAVQGRILLAAPLEIGLIEQTLTDYLQTQDSIEFDESSQRFIAQRQLKIGACVVKTQLIDKIEPIQQLDLWLELIQKRGLAYLPWTEEATQLAIRVQLAGKYATDVAWPDFSPTGLLAHLSDWLGPYLGDIQSYKQLAQLDLCQILASCLDWDLQQRLAQLLPTQFVVPTGTHYPLVYELEQAPKLSVRIQEVFGLTKTPCVADGNLPIVFELLSPARRPIQITADLAGFWQSSYQMVKKEMKGRYPKHYWPDDPAQAIATNKTKKFM